MKPSVTSPQTKAQHTVRGRSSHNGRHKPSRESDAYKTADAQTTVNESCTNLHPETIQIKALELFNFFMRNGYTKRKALRNTINDLLKLYDIKERKK